MKNAIEYEVGSDNVFADLGLSDAKERQVKVRLAMKISDLLARRKFSQKEAANLLGTTQARISAIINYKLREVSLEKLIEFLTRLDQDIQIVVKRKARSHPTGEVTVAA